MSDKVIPPLGGTVCLDFACFNRESAPLRPIDVDQTPTIKEGTIRSVGFMHERDPSGEHGKDRESAPFYGGSGLL